MTTQKILTRIQKLVWISIYSGLILLVLGIFLKGAAPTGACVIQCIGGVMVAAGVVLIYVRSRLTLTP